MTISSENRKAGPYIGQGVLAIFPFTFKVFSANDLVVTEFDTSSSVETALVINSGYTVQLNADQNANPGGTITLPAVLATGKTLTITSDVAYLQPTDLTNQGGFFPQTITTALDRLTVLIQQLRGLIGRGIRQPVSDADAMAELPPAADRAGKVLTFDANGNPVATVPESGSIAEFAAYLSNDTDPAKGAGMVGDNGRTQAEKNADIISILDGGIVDNTGAISIISAFQSVLNSYSGDNSLEIYVPKGKYLLDGPITLKSRRIKIHGPGVFLLSTLDSGFRFTSGVEWAEFRGLGFNGTLYGSNHYDEPDGIQTIIVEPGVTPPKHLGVYGCRFWEIYGGGVNGVGHCEIKGNAFYNVAGFNKTTDPLGQQDNYGDAVRISNWTAGMTDWQYGGEVSNNYIVTTRLGRIGVCSEFNVSELKIANNFISGYDRGLHHETVGTIYVENNHITNCNTAQIASGARIVSKGNTYENGLNNNNGMFNYAALYLYALNSDSSFEDDTITQIGSKPALLSAGVTSNLSMLNCIFNGEVSPNPIVDSDFIGCNFKNSVATFPSADGVNFERNEFLNSKLAFSGMMRCIIDNNKWFFNNSATANVALATYGVTGGNRIVNNKIKMTGSTLFQDYVVDSYLGDNSVGESEFSNNQVLTDLPLTQMFVYSATAAHQPFSCYRQNYKTSTAGVRIVLPYRAKYDDSGWRGDVYYGASAPTSGTYRQGDIMINTAPTAGGTREWICVAAGTPGTWKAVTGIAA